MKILFISSSPLEYSSSSNMRNIALLKGFIENGHKIYTLTPTPQKDAALYDQSICNLNIERRYYISLGKVHSKITVKKNKKSIIKNTIYKLVKNIKMYDMRSSLAAKEVNINEKFDIIISSSDPKSSHLIAEKLIKRNPSITSQWIQYWGDPFADDINNKRFIPKFLLKKEEKRIISLCNIVLYVSPFTLEKQKKMYPIYSKKMFFLPIPYNNEKYYKSNNNNVLKIGYFGEYYSRNRNILPLHEAIKSEKDKQLIICGNSDLKLEKNNNIHIYTRQPLEQIKKYEEECDVLVCICNKNGTQIPGKIYHYSATNKPILIILDGENYKEMKDYFDSYNRFIICKNNSKDISKMLDNIKNEKKEYFPVKSLNSKEISKKLLNICKGE